MRFLTGKLELVSNILWVIVVLILLPQIVFDISVWLHFGIFLIFLSPFAQDMQIWAFFDQILAVMASELGLWFQNLWNLYLELNIFA